MENAFVNCSKQLDNLLLDGMEPFDMDGLTEFEFGYVAGHHVKTPDINGKDLEQRICQEVEECYTPAVRKTLETKAVSIKASAESAITMPVLLPVYYICKGDLMAAVNGQTGKVSVRALKESHYYFLPWWLKAIFATLVISGAAFGGMYLLGMNLGGSLLITAMLAFVFFVVLLCLYSDTTKNSFSVEAGPTGRNEIYNSFQSYQDDPAQHCRPVPSGHHCAAFDRLRLPEDQPRRIRSVVLHSGTGRSDLPAEIRHCGAARQALDLYFVKRW